MVFIRVTGWGGARANRLASIAAAVSDARPRCQSVSMPCAEEEEEEKDVVLRIRSNMAMSVVSVAHARMVTRGTRCR